MKIPKKPKMPKDVIKFFRATGSEGGKMRAARHSKEQLSKWAKMGGRPRKSSSRGKRTDDGRL